MRTEDDAVAAAALSRTVAEGIRKQLAGYPLSVRGTVMAALLGDYLLTVPDDQEAVNEALIVVTGSALRFYRNWRERT